MVRRHNSVMEDGHSVTAAFGLHQHSDRHALHAPVLVLNASYEPINVCAARRAIVLVLKGVAMTEEENGHFLHAAALRAAGAVSHSAAGISPDPAPDTRSLAQEHSSARPEYLPVLRGSVVVGDLTLDHVMPRSRGGASTWENLVACLPHLQPPQGKPNAPRSRYEADARTACLQPPHQPSHHAADGKVGR